RRQAVSLVPELPKYRAAGVGSVAAGCAGLQQLSPHLEPADGSEETGHSEDSADSADSADTASSPPEITADEATQLGDEALRAIQTALAAEYAASWVYGLVTAYLPAPFEKSVERGRNAHQRLARSARQLLSAAGAEPKPRQAAYVP